LKKIDKNLRKTKIYFKILYLVILVIEFIWNLFCKDNDKPRYCNENYHFLHRSLIFTSISKLDCLTELSSERQSGDGLNKLLTDGNIILFVL